MNVSTKKNIITIEMTESEASKLQLALDLLTKPTVSIPQWVKERSSIPSILNEALKGIIPMLRHNPKD